VGEGGSAEGEAVGPRLKRLRLERRLSQRELACPGVSYAYISRIEAGTRQPSVKALRKLARTLNVTTAYLETGSDIDDLEERELRLADAELALRLGDAAAAEGQLRRLFEEAVAAGDQACAARARIALALAADERGDHLGAVAGFEEAFRIERPSAQDRLDVFTTLGRAYGALGEREREVALYEECLEEVARVRIEDSSTQTRYRILLSYALSDAGDLGRAEQVLRDALCEAALEDDPYMRIRVFWSLARLSEMEGRSKVALRYARRAIALLAATEDDLQRARAHLLAAWIMNSAKDAEGAKTQLEEAERFFGEAASADDAAILTVEHARTEALLGHSEDAIRFAGQAIEKLGAQHDAILGTAFWALAEGLALQAELEPACDAFERAVELLAQNRRWREATEASRAWAALLRTAGRHQHALDILERAANFPFQAVPDRPSRGRTRAQR
jgi:transcriptional regulator with XRE-family HTH domain